MGKNILVQRRGRGYFIFRAPTHRRIHPTGYNPVNVHTRGWVRELLHETARGAPLARLTIESGEDVYVPAPEGLSVGQPITIGAEAPAEIGNIKTIGKIPEGTMICNIENKPGDGGTVARSSGSFALVVSHTPQGTELRLPSGRSVFLNNACRAMIGVVAGSGRTEKPFLKAGPKWFLQRSRGRKWPVVKGQAMISASHPHGGGRHKHAGKPTTVGRWTSPGRKVGNIAARQTGRAKRRTAR
ncbi:50S ribosomal protein L2 [archaeon 13_1_20CM_2_54_9]|nr:MAG: 50S ribosomal protein L2 [Crenarchaeota archaeon 13_1_40CM_3_53_5]OLE77386.1 MAG: 50S ribosomal protein L2 [archaeon 13_1_20CM_2_54_9]TMI24096.1 MAG: 50S ribosomal protein L2 [Candidatus Bathyarchaeota archaeon]TMI32027.1 MAG: 50S ribosomal protein L2 [Candidatus Bathyarchaeota archaeon]